jgi:hypothetical protein
MFSSQNVERDLSKFTYPSFLIDILVTITTDIKQNFKEITVRSLERKETTGRNELNQPGCLSSTVATAYDSRNSE